MINSLSDFADCVRINDKMVSANRSLRSIFKDYDEKIQSVKDLICAVMEEHKKEILPATIILMQDAIEKNRPVHAVWFMSAAVDMINEKSNNER